VEELFIPINVSTYWT